MRAQCLSGMQNLVSNESEQDFADELDLESLKDVVAEAYHPESKGRALLEMAFGHAPQFMVVCDMNGRIVLASTAAKRLAQVTPEGKHLELAPRIWGDLFDLNGQRIPAEDWPSTRALHGEVTWQRECQLVQSGGLSWSILFSAAPVTARRLISGAVFLMTDLTRQKQAERMLREEAIRRERSHIAADIHDTFAQSLSAIVLQLQAVEDELVHDFAKAHQHLQRAQSLTRETLTEARRSIWTLSHESLEKEELSSALSSLAKQLFAATSVEVQLSLQKEPCPLSSDVRLELLRLGREALANVLKHARATKVHIQLSYGRRDMQLSVVDNGRGFERRRSSSTGGGFGLNSMRRRAALLGGRLVIDTQPGHGTRIIALVPVPLHFRPDSSA
jgi:signal transduction histidine kinase